MLNSNQIEQFHKDGFLVVPSVLTNEQVARVRSFLINLFDSGVQFEGDTHNYRQDICARYPEMRWLLFHPPIASALKSLLGEDFVYLPEMAAHDSSFGGWHKDTTSQEVAGHLFHYHADYLMVEAALYLQDNNEEYGGGLDVILGSHFSPDKYAKERISSQKSFWGKVRNKLWGKVRNKLRQYWLGYSVPSKSGDLVLFNFKIDHQATGSNKHIPSERRKIAIFFACSANNEHAESYKQFILSRADYHYLKNHQYPEKLRELAKENNITLI